MIWGSAVCHELTTSSCLDLGNFYWSVASEQRGHDFLPSFVWMGAGYRSRYSDWLRAGRSGARIPVGGEIFLTCPDRSWGPPSLLYSGYRDFPGVKSGRGVTLAPHPLLVPWSWKGRAIPLLSLWVVRPVQSLSACTRVHFTFFTFVWMTT